MFPFVTAVIDWSTEYRKAAVMTRVHTCCSEIIGDVTGGMGQRARSEEDLCCLERKLE